MVRDGRSAKGQTMFQSRLMKDFPRQDSTSEIGREDLPAWQAAGGRTGLLWIPDEVQLTGGATLDRLSYAVSKGR